MKIGYKSLETIFWILVALSSAAACVAWSFHAGKDMNWDGLNYHYYVAYHWAEGRLYKDFLASSIQSYLNPISYLPFYYMVQANWSSIAIGAALAGMHSINLLLIGLIADAILPADTRGRKFWIICSVLLAAISPIFAIEVGSTFNDITTSILVLAGYAVVVRGMAASRNPASFKPGHIRIWLVAGVLLGAAIGMKLTNSIFLLALALLILAGERLTLGGIFTRGGVLWPWRNRRLWCRQWMVGMAAFSKIWKPVFSLLQFNF